MTMGHGARSLRKQISQKKWYTSSIVEGNTRSSIPYPNNDFEDKVVSRGPNRSSLRASPKRKYSNETTFLDAPGSYSEEKSNRSQ